MNSWYCLLLLLLARCAVAAWWPTQRNNSTQQRLIFVKTHKTGSSTLSSILHRYCDEHSGVICYTEGPIPRNAAVFGYTYDWFTHASFPPVDILSHHIRYWPTLLHAFVPEPAPIITIVREPAARFLSGWDYSHKHWGEERDIYSIVRQLPLDLEKLPEDFQTLLTANCYEQSLCPPGPLWAVRNASEPSCIQTLRDVRRGAISLVLITEHMDESLVLLGRALGWSLDELVYQSMKNSSAEVKSSHDHPPSDVVHKIHGWLRNDVILYQTALRLFEQRVAAQDASFRVEVERFRQKKLELRATCARRNQAALGKADRSLCARLATDHGEWVREHLHS